MRRGGTWLSTACEKEGLCILHLLQCGTISRPRAPGRPRPSVKSVPTSLPGPRRTPRTFESRAMVHAWVCGCVVCRGVGLPALASAVHRGFPCSHRGAHRVGQLALGRGRATPLNASTRAVCFLCAPCARPAHLPTRWLRLHTSCHLRAAWGLVFHDGCAAEYQLIAPRRASPPGPPHPHACVEWGTA